MSPHTSKKRNFKNNGTGFVFLTVAVLNPNDELKNDSRPLISLGAEGRCASSQAEGAPLNRRSPEAVGYCPYEKSVVMESMLLQDGRKSLTNRPFRLIEP